jgi:hypothetical protein
LSLYAATLSLTKPAFYFEKVSQLHFNSHFEQQRLSYVKIQHGNIVALNGYYYCLLQASITLCGFKFSYASSKNLIDSFGNEFEICDCSHARNRLCLIVSEENLPHFQNDKYSSD